MHGEVCGIPWRADPDLVSGLDRGVEKTNGKQRQKYLIHFLYLPLQNLDSAGSPYASPFTPHGYLITLSALASTFGGIVRPICFAVFTLMTSANFVGASTGREPGLAPLRILSTNTATRRY